MLIGISMLAGLGMIAAGLHLVLGAGAALVFAGAALVTISTLAAVGTLRDEDGDT